MMRATAMPCLGVVSAKPGDVITITRKADR